MANEDIIEKLRSLTRQQKIVLRGVCEGKLLKQIAKELFLSINTIKTHMGNVYIKFGLTHLPPSLRRKIIFEEYWPVFKEFDFEESIIYQDEPEDTEEPEPVPEEVIDQVDEDEKALMVVEPEIIDVLPLETEKKKKRRRRNGWKWILTLIIIGLLAFGGFKLYEFVSDFIGALQIQAAPVQEEKQEPVAQVVPTNTLKPTEPTNEPTNTIVVPTSTTAPTKTPSPIVSLPFFDDFSNGISSPWKVAAGNWLVTETGATISINDIYDSDGSIVLDDPTLTDYKVRVKVHTPSMWAANQGQFGIIVRYGSNRDQNLIFYMDSNARFKWAFTESLSELPFYLPPVTGDDKEAGDTDVTVEIEVVGNTFIGRVDGAKVDQFSISGFENGGIALVTACGNVGRCPSFSDLSIEPLN